MDLSEISSGSHILTINAKDRVGSETTKSFNFILDSKPPALEIKSPKNNTSVSNSLFIDLQLIDENLPEKDKLSFLLPTGERIIDKTEYSFNTTAIDNGQYQIRILGIDAAGNSVVQDIMFTVDHSLVDITKPKVLEQSDFDPVFLLIIVGISIAIIVGIVFSQKKRKIVSNQ